MFKMLLGYLGSWKARVAFLVILGTKLTLIALVILVLRSQREDEDGAKREGQYHCSFFGHFN